MVGVNCKQPIACAGQDHLEKWSGRLVEVNGGPQGRIAESSTSPMEVDVSEWEQCLDAILPNGELKDLAEDFCRADRFDFFTGGPIVIINEQSVHQGGRRTFRWSLQQAWSGEREGRRTSPTATSRHLPRWGSGTGGPCISFCAPLWQSCFQNCQGHVREKLDLRPPSSSTVIVLSVGRGRITSPRHDKTTSDEPMVCHDLSSVHNASSKDGTGCQIEICYMPLR